MRASLPLGLGLVLRFLGADRDVDRSLVFKFTDDSVSIAYRGMFVGVIGTLLALLVVAALPRTGDGVIPLLLLLFVRLAPGVVRATVRFFTVMAGDNGICLGAL